MSKKPLSHSTAAKEPMPVLAASSSSFLFGSITAPAYRWVHTGQMVSGLGNSLLYILKGKPASMLSYSSKYFSGQQSSGYPARHDHSLPVSVTQMHLPPDSTCSSPSAWGSYMESPSLNHHQSSNSSGTAQSQTQSLFGDSM